MSNDARSIYQDFLDISGRLLIDGAFEKLSTMMSYPMTIETSDGSLTNQSPEDNIESAKAFSDYLKRMGVRDFHRLVKSADFVQGHDDLIDGVHETFILKGGDYVVEPYRNAMRLRLVEGEWRAVHFRSSVSNVTVPLLNPAQLRARVLHIEEAGQMVQQTKAETHDGLHNSN